MNARLATPRRPGSRSPDGTARSSPAARSPRPNWGEALVWLLVIAGVLNFTPALFRTTGLAAEPAWTKGLKDIPLLLVLGGAVFAGWRAGRGRPSLDAARRWLGSALPNRAAGLAPLAVWERRLALSLGLLAVFMVATAVILRPPLPGFGVSFRYYCAYPLLVWAVGVLVVGARARRRLLLLLAALGALEGVIAVFNFLGYPAETYYSNYVVLQGLGYPRAIGTLGAPGNLALFLGLPILLLAAGAGWRGPLRWILLAAALLGAALTFSKAVGVTLAAGVLTLVLTGPHRLSRRARLSVAFALVAGLAVLALSIVGRFDGRLTTQTVFGSRVDTVTVAFEEWIAGIDLFLFGGGFGSLLYSAGPEGVAELITDNMALTLALEGGLIGLILFCAVVGCVLALLLLAVRQGHGRANRAFLGYAVFFIPYALISVNFRLFPAAMLLWLAAGLAVAEAREAGTDPEHASAKPVGDVGRAGGAERVAS